MPSTKSRKADGWFDEMQRLFQSANYRMAAAAYDEAVDRGEQPNNDALLLRARLFLKTDSKQIVPFLLTENLTKPTSLQEARREMYLGTGYSRLGEFSAADKHFKNAEGRIEGAAQLAELAAHVTRRYLEQGDFDAAAAWQKQSTVDQSLFGKIRSEHLASYVAARVERYRDQAVHLIRVLDLIGSKRAQYAEDWYVAVHTLAGLARELPYPEAADRAKAEVECNFEWSSDFEVSHFQALKAVAWCQALAGDELSCFRYLRLAQDVAVGDAWRTILHVDRSYFASIVGEQHWSANEFAAAESLARSIAWDDTSGEERVALLLLAEMATVHAPKRAFFYIARFNDLGKLRSNIHHFAFDHRLEAMAAFSSGMVSLMAGESNEAEKTLREAWTTFDRIGYDVRAGLAALGLRSATGKERWLHLADDKLERYPRSWLARSLKLSPESAQKEQNRLSKMQASVVDLVCEGFATDEIAKRLGISRNTVLNHLKVAYRKMGVNSRPALVVKAMGRNQKPS
jgi:DNA-binding CsgD family transcriptional regulator